MYFTTVYVQNPVVAQGMFQKEHANFVKKRGAEHAPLTKPPGIAGNYPREEIQPRKAESCSATEPGPVPPGMERRATAASWASTA